MNTLGGATLRKSFRMLKPGGKLISGPPDVAFAETIGANARLKTVTGLIETGMIRRVVDRIVPFDATTMAYLGAGRARGKVVVKVK